MRTSLLVPRWQLCYSFSTSRVTWCFSVENHYYQRLYFICVQHNRNNAMQDQDDFVLLLQNRIKSLQGITMQLCETVQTAEKMLCDVLQRNKEVQVKWLNRRFRKRSNYIPLNRRKNFLSHRRCTQPFDVMKSIDSNEFFRRVGMPEDQFFAIVTEGNELVDLYFIVDLFLIGKRTFCNRTKKKKKAIPCSSSCFYLVALVTVLSTCTLVSKYIWLLSCLYQQWNQLSSSVSLCCYCQPQIQQDWWTKYQIVW